MSRLPLSSCLLLLCVLGCAGARVADGEPVYSVGQQAGEPLRVQGRHITGPNSSLVLLENGMRGNYLGRPVDVSWNWQQLTGSVGTAAARLELAEGDDIHVKGSFGGLRVDYVLNATWFVGRVGTCDYVFRRQERGFLGRRGCTGPMEGDIFVRFPAPLLERPLGEKTALLLLALIDTTGSTSSAISPERRIAPVDRIQPLQGRP